MLYCFFYFNSKVLPGQAYREAAAEPEAEEKNMKEYQKIP